MLVNFGYEVQVLKFVSQVDTKFNGVVVYHNRAFNVQHMHSCYQVITNAKFVFIGFFDTIDNPLMVNVPFSIDMVQRALAEVAA
jgi:hypothetical protein